MMIRRLVAVVVLLAMLVSAGCCHRHCGFRRGGKCCVPCCSSPVYPGPIHADYSGPPIPISPISAKAATH